MGPPRHGTLHLRLLPLVWLNAAKLHTTPAVVVVIVHLCVRVRARLGRAAEAVVVAACFLPQGYDDDCVCAPICFKVHRLAGPSDTPQSLVVAMWCGKQLIVLKDHSSNLFGILSY